MAQYYIIRTLAVSTGAVSNIKSGCAVTMMPKILLSGGSINDEISINAGEVTFEVGGTYGGTGSPTFGNGFTWTAEVSVEGSSAWTGI
ncbi:MAG: hypothetical protein IPK25_16275 [Saprospiraceae bacterium]|nr:hypothetical protein [Saprospiraceae bacterium]